MKKTNLHHILLHTGQHYDFNMSDVFFKELALPEPDYSLGVGSAAHGEQTGTILMGCERIMQDIKPALVIVYGDTNTTLGGALAAAKLHIPVAHIEAGLRSFNKEMPEEINRILADHVSSLLFVPTEQAVKNLAGESIIEHVYLVGDIMFDLAMQMERAHRGTGSGLLRSLQLEEKQYILSTIHRAENTDNRDRLKNICRALNSLAVSGYRIVFPMHPRTNKSLHKYQLGHILEHDNITIREPVSYTDMIRLEKSAKIIITDSGGVQKEAYFFKVPSVIPRSSTEWTEINEAGWNITADADEKQIVAAVIKLWSEDQTPHWYPFYGDGRAGEKIIEKITGYLSRRDT
jgi:UDP-N-acetylglucosamine 2-epimerase